MKRPTVVVASLALGLLVVSSGCSKGKVSKKTTQGQQAATTPQKPGKGPPALSGIVKEAKDGGGYTYLKLEVEGREVWAAVAKVQVKVGQKVNVANAMLMRDFQSKAMDRKFKEIYFGVVAPAGKAGALPGKMPSGHPGVMPPGHPKMANSGGKRAQGGTKAVAEPLPKAAGPEGKTVAEIYAEADKLKGKRVAVRGKVVKFTGAVMGRNWIHLQDGSGAADARNFDLTVTSKDSVEMDKVVVARGILAVAKVFGAGYSYRVIVEQASLSDK